MKKKLKKEKKLSKETTTTTTNNDETVSNSKKSKKSKSSKKEKKASKKSDKKKSKEKKSKSKIKTKWSVCINNFLPTQKRTFFIKNLDATRATLRSGFLFLSLKHSFIYIYLSILTHYLFILFFFWSETEKKNIEPKNPKTKKTKQTIINYFWNQTTSIIQHLNY